MTWTQWLHIWPAALAPLSLLAAALASDRRTLTVARGATWLSLAAAVWTLVAALWLGPAQSPTLGLAGLGLALRVDVLGGVFGALIAFVGLIVVGYSRNYLDGDPGQARFVRGLCLTLGLVQGFALAGNLGQLIVCWIGAGLAVNRLLLFRPGRQAAVLAARKRFLACRLADACLIAAAVILWRAAGSGDVGTILAVVRGGAADLGPAPVLLALAAILSSAQLPFHGWLLEVMETPTPVSALLHAGVVNAGGFLLLRFGDVMAPHGGALTLLAAVGGATAIFGSLVMLTQTSVKVGLAYSTIAQMGFMLLEIGLGAFGAALLHIVAHALYKAHAFLSAGGAAQGKVAQPAGAAPWPLVLAVPAGVVAAAVAATALGVGPAQHAGGFVLWTVLLLGLTRVALQGTPAVALVGAGVAVGAYLVGQGVFARLTADLPVAATAGYPALAVAAAVVALMTALVCLQLRLPGRAASPAWARAYALVAGGFHLNTLANRWVLRFWPAAPVSSGASQ